MPKWLIILLAIAALAGVVLLEQSRPLPPASSAAEQVPATTQTASSDVEVPALPVAQTPSSVAEVPAVVAPQTPAERVASQTASDAVQPSIGPSETPTAPQTPTEPAPVQTVSAFPAASAVSPDPWAGMSLQQFLGQAAGELVRLSPETVTFLGLGPLLGMRDDHLDLLTTEAEREYYDLEQAIVDHLATFDLSLETPDDRLNAEIYRASILNELAGRSFTDNAYSVTSYMDSYPTYIEWFLTSLHPLATLDNAEDYVSRLSEIPTRFRELQARLVDSEALNAVPPRFMLEKAVGQIRRTGETPARETDFYTALEAGLTAMADVDEVSLRAVSDRAADVIEKEVLPAYLELAEFVSGMAAQATDDAGVWKQTNGAEYYAYCLQSQTTTDLTADEIYNLGVAEVDRIEGEIRTTAAALGFDSTLSIPGLYDRLSATTGTSLGEETIARCQAIIDDIGPRVASAFTRMPTQSLIVVDGGYGTVLLRRDARRHAPGAVLHSNAHGGADLRTPDRDLPRGRARTRVPGCVCLRGRSARLHRRTVVHGLLRGVGPLRRAIGVGRGRLQRESVRQPRPTPRRALPCRAARSRSRHSREAMDLRAGRRVHDPEHRTRGRVRAGSRSNATS